MRGKMVSRRTRGVPNMKGEVCVCVCACVRENAPIHANNGIEMSHRNA